jgi:hypothetical protein
MKTAHRAKSFVLVLRFLNIDRIYVFCHAVAARVPDEEASARFFDRPGRREAGGLRHSICGGVARRSGFGRAVDETEHIEHVLAAFNVRHGRCNRSH